MTAAAQTEVIEGVATEVRDEPERGLAIIPQQRAHLMSGLGAVALLSDEDFAQNLELLAKGKARAQAIQKAILTDGVDYGREPGIDRPFLHKPGAEVMEKAYGFATSYTIERKVGNGDDVPALEYIVHAKVHLGDTDGPVIAEGVGSCNTHESKYRFRRGERSCPSCGKPAIIKGKADGKLQGKWWCAAFKDGCGKTYDPTDSRIVDQQVGQVENENPYDLANTILKMARKRAGVDAILTATGTSGLFTQDSDSPAVADRGGSTQQTGQAQAGQAQATERPAPKAPTLPKVPEGITEETSLGEVTIEGWVEVTDKSATDGSLRQTPTGPYLGFRMAVTGGANVGQVIATGPLAEALSAAVGSDPNMLHGLRVTVTGEMLARPWQNAEGEQMPAARRTDISRIQSDEWTLPADVAEQPKAAAGRKSQAKPKATDKPAAAAPATGGPGLTAPAFQKVLDGAKVAGAYALQVAKEKWPDAVTLHGLTDQQRLELAAQMDLLTEDED